jgi:drug/metabolite transporter (DMT)-like permease
LLVRRSARGPVRGPIDGGPRTGRDWAAIVVLGISDATNVVLFFGAMAVTSVAVAVLTHYLAPVFVALFAPRVLGTARSPRAIGLSRIALLGLALVLEPWRSLDGGTWLGALLGAGSAVCYAANVLITKRIAARFTAEEQLVYHGAIAALLLSAVAIVFGAPWPHADGAARVAVASLGPGALAGLAFLYGLRKIPAEHASILTFLEPLTAVAVAAVAFGERPGPLALVGGALVLGAGLAAIRVPSAVAARERSAAT